MNVKHVESLYFGLHPLREVRGCFVEVKALAEVPARRIFLLHALATKRTAAPAGPRIVSRCGFYMNPSTAKRLLKSSVPVLTSVSRSVAASESWAVV